jgi:hypothetical protein
MDLEQLESIFFASTHGTGVVDSAGEWDSFVDSLQEHGLIAPKDLSFFERLWDEHNTKSGEYHGPVPGISYAEVQQGVIKEFGVFTIGAPQTTPVISSRRLLQLR